MTFEPDQISREAAARWLARSDAGLGPAEQVEFQHWLQSDPKHASAWREMEAAWGLLDRPQTAGYAPVLVQELATRALRRRVRLRRSILSGLAAAALVAVAFTVWIQRPAAIPVSTEDILEAGFPASITMLRPEIHVLEDGSRVELNQNAVISVHYTTALREIRLISGELHCTVVSDPVRPFVVRAGGIETRALGTAFLVERMTGATDVLVTEGRVGVERTGAESDAQVSVPAGNRVLMIEAAAAGLPQVEPVSEAEVARRLQWRSPRLRLSGARLDEVIAQLNRMSRVPLTLGDATLGDLRLSGTFRADNADGFVRMLVENYGVKLGTSENGEIILHRE